MGEAQEGHNVCIIMADFYYCMAETNTTCKYLKTTNKNKNRPKKRKTETIKQQQQQKKTQHKFHPIQNLHKPLDQP